MTVTAALQGGLHSMGCPDVLSSVDGCATHHLSKAGQLVQQCLGSVRGIPSEQPSFSHRSLARVGYATQPSLGDDSVNIIIFTYISMGFVKLKIKVSPGLNFSC